MQRLAVETTVSTTPEAIYERLAAVEEYPRYAEYLASVEGVGDDVPSAGGAAATGGAVAEGGRRRETEGETDGGSDGQSDGGSDGWSDGWSDDGAAGNEGRTYALRFAWWRLSYTVHSRVTATDPPNRIDWRLAGEIDARGAWTVTPVSVPADAAPGTEAASRVRFAVRYDPDSFEPAGLELPPLASLDWLAERVTPLVLEEARRVVGRLVADLEGTERAPSLSVEHGPDVTV